MQIRLSGKKAIGKDARFGGMNLVNPVKQPTEIPKAVKESLKSLFLSYAYRSTDQMKADIKSYSMVLMEY